MKHRLVQSGKYVAYCCLVALCSIGLQRFCYTRTDGFALYKIFSSLSPISAWEVPPAPEEMNGTLQTVFDQPFYYLGRGAQIYAFVSQDGQTIIKFCKFDHLRPPLWCFLSFFPFFCEKERVERFWRKRGLLEQEFNSYKIAYSEPKEETGLIYLHLNKTAHLKKTLTIYDKSRVAHKLDLDTMEFIVQKRAIPFYAKFATLIQTQGEEAAKNAIHQLIELLTSRCSKGISDGDPKLNKNFGFLDTRPIQIDIGRFAHRDFVQSKEEMYKEISRITQPLYEWLEKQNPTLSAYLLDEIHRISL